MIDRDRARELAKTALAASNADETEVTIEHVEEELNRFTADHPVQNLVRNMVGISIRVRVNGREGKAKTGTPTAEAVKKTVARAIAVAGHMPAPREELVPLPEQQDYQLRGRDPLRPNPVATAESVAAMTARARDSGCSAAGIQTGLSTFAYIANSRGLEVADVDNAARVSFSVYKDDGAGWASRTAATPGDIDSEALSKKAVAKAVRSVNPVGIEPGGYTVILEPAAVASLLLFASYKGFGAQQIRDGSSFLAGKLGEQVVGSNISIDDDVYHPLALGHVFDAEGMPRQTVHLIDQGIAKGVVYDSRTAVQSGCKSTGHALPQPSASGPLATNLVLAAGDSSDLRKDIDYGVLVTQLHYTNMVEPTQLTLTGMTRNGTFLIEKGEVTNPIKNMRFTHSLVDALKRVTGISQEQELASALFGGFTVVPAVRIDGFNFSSKTDF